SKYLEDFALSPDAGYISMVVRGKAFAGGAWEGSIQQYGKKHDVHYRLATYLPREQGIVLVSDEGDKEHFEIHSLRKDFVSTNEVQEVKVFDQHDFGRPYSLEVSPCGKWIAFANHRNELMILNLESSELISIDQNKFGMIRSYNWSADSRWLAYVSSSNRLSTEVRIFGLEKKDIHTVSIPVKNDTEACFDPEGKYLYIMSERTFNPLHDELQYDITFHKTTKPYLITLREDIRSPFLPEPKALEPKPADEPKPGEKKDDADAKQIKPIKIDFEGITDRIVEFPVAADVMGGLYATTGKIFYYKFDPSAPREARNEAKADIYTFDLEKMEEQLFLSGVSGYVFNLDSSALIVLINKQLRILSAKRDPKAELPKETQAGRNTGWIDMSRIKTEIDPLSEWRQMFREAWRLQKYHFWTEDMSGIDWEKIFKRYYPLVERIGSRAEFSDLIWEMQGELGTSHCYEFGGDYKSPPIYRIGSLGVDWIFDAKKQQWKIGKIIKGDQWLGKNRSPLMNPGLNVPEGSVLLAINGIKLSAGQTPERTLVNYAGQPVQLTVCDSKGKDTRTITVNTMSQEFSARYRDWVEANRRYVHEKSHGKAGYIHIPDMGSEGLVEFHRYFLTELDHEALVVDVRYNGGGSVSQLILEKLARKRIGYDKTRWFGYEPYPSEAPAGALVCLTNEHAGSDGDIFSHAFKLMKLGKLVGKRTWGGVIGIWPRHWLVDGTITTQPEFSFWFKDVGWGVENYGTDPDIEVDILPQDYAASKDPQLDMAIKTVLEDLKKNPALKPDFSGRPNLGF
ncbi:MAG: PDZ domain-containing protein, partial [Candidatus Cloacimonetes bacterium]|nr:PDZ domain-containing protein [Candidatus Cloacimonadota bacterium]